MLIARIAVPAYGPDISLHNIRSHKPTKKPEVRLLSPELSLPNGP